MYTASQKNGEHWEPLAPGVRILVSPRHRFNTDTILLARFSAPKHRDICCDFGSGCGTIPILWEIHDQPKHIYALELQQDAVLLSQKSIAENDMQSDITILQKDIRDLMLQAVPPFCETLDLISCNPPYKELGTGLVSPDAGKAIARHECELTIEEIGRSAARALKYGGRFCMCQRPQRLNEIMTALSACRLEPKRLRLVQQRIGSAPSLFLLECRKGGRPGLQIEPVLLIEGEDGGFSPEMLEIYGNYKTAKEGEPV